LFLCVGHSVRVISVQTGATLHALEAHTANVTGVCLDAGNPLRIWSAGLDGNVCLWDYEDSVLLKVWYTKVAGSSLGNAPPDRFFFSSFALIHH
jgi:WD40 repeat protein